LPEQITATAIAHTSHYASLDSCMCASLLLLLLLPLLPRRLMPT
jgi:hypothetical protein